MQRTFCLLGLLGIGLTAVTSSKAEAVYVDQHGGGTNASPYKSIQLAINDPNSHIIIVLPGTYDENLVIDKNLKLYGYDGPHTTRINGSAGGNTINLQPGLDVWIEGLNISSGNYGVSVPTTGTLHLRNCILCGNSSHGLHVEAAAAPSPTVYVYNCIFAANGGSGIYIATGGRIYYPNMTVFNSILMANARYGLETYSGASYGSLDGGVLTLDYNCCVGNQSGSYIFRGDSSLTVPTGSHSIQQAPEFVGGGSALCTEDFRLLPSSPCKDTGHPGIGFLDPDGTRCDIGAFGGPGAQSFYTNPNDGPFVRSVSIDQAVVPRGSTFTVRAKGAVR